MLQVIYSSEPRLPIAPSTVSSRCLLEVSHSHMTCFELVSCECRFLLYASERDSTDCSVINVVRGQARSRFMLKTANLE